MYIDIEEVLWRKIEKQPTRWNEISVNFRGKVGHYRNGSLCYCFSLVGQHLYISSARKFNEATIVPFISFTSIGAVVIEPRWDLPLSSLPRFSS